MLTGRLSSAFSLTKGRGFFFLSFWLRSPCGVGYVWGELGVGGRGEDLQYCPQASLVGGGWGEGTGLST